MELQNVGLIKQCIVTFINNLMNEYKIKGFEMELILGDVMAQVRAQTELELAVYAKKLEDEISKLNGDNTSEEGHA